MNIYINNQSNIYAIAYTIISTNVSVVNRPCRCLHVALHKALHEALLKLYQSSAKALQKLYKSSAQTSIQSFVKALLNTLPKPLQELCLRGK